MNKAGTNGHDSLNKAYNWLQEKAVAAVDASRIIHPEFGKVMHLVHPHGTGHYQAMFLRDFVYKIIAMPELFADNGTEDALEMFFERMSVDYVPPDYIHVLGHHQYWVIGWQPPTDNIPCLAIGVEAHCRARQDYSFLKRHADNLWCCLEGMTVHPASGLLWIDPMAPHSGYGYTDQIRKSGEELMSSLFLVVACERLARGFTEIGRKRESAKLIERAVRVRSGIATLFESEWGLFMAASLDCRNPDIWGSAFGVAHDLFGDHGLRACRALANLHEKITWRGQVRQLPAPILWESQLSRSRKYQEFRTGEFHAYGRLRSDIAAREPNTYQNGAYWATASGWLAAAYANIDRDLAIRFLLDLVDFFQSEGVWECVHPNGHRKEREYTISLINPLIGFNRLLKTNDVELN